MGLLEFLLVQSVAKGIKSSSDEAARRKLEEKTEAAAEAAGLTVYAYVLTQVRESIRNSVMEKQNDLGKLETYLNICMDQRILSEYHRDVIWEEAKGQCALRRLQATGGAPWAPHDILHGLAPEKILNQCDRDADSYGLQIVYLDQQVFQGNVTRETADLILNIYKLARDERG
jgi:hypothetical protein